MAKLTGLALCVCLLFGSGSSASAQTASQPSSGTGTTADKKVDDRDAFEASFYTGLQIDTFAADDLKKYLNPDESSKQHEQMIAGFDFAYRFSKNASRRQFWVYGETVYGVRSADVDCKADPDIVVCKPFTDVASAGERTLYILRKASSLEAFAGVRYEFADFNRDGDFHAKLYLKAQAGFLAVEKTGNDVIDMHHVALGVLGVNGKFNGSYLEAGWGRTDLFHEHPNRRLKIDGFLSWPLPGTTKTEKIGDTKTTVAKNAGAGIRPFVQLTVDADLGSGADSIQTFIGFDLSIDQLFGGGESSLKRFLRRR
jgi:hypothetical protein